MGYLERGSGAGRTRKVDRGGRAECRGAIYMGGARVVGHIGVQMERRGVASVRMFLRLEEGGGVTPDGPRPVW